MGKMIPSAEPWIVRYLHDKASARKIPVNVTMELTARCNFDCKMCYIHNTDCNSFKDKEMSASDWTAVAAQAKEAGALFILLTGGEPFVRSDFPEIYESLAKMGFMLSVNSNGFLLSDRLLDLFVRYMPNRINISLYGASDEAYSAVCGVPAFGTVSANIKKLKAAGIPVKINSSITPGNAGEIGGIIDFCEENELVFKGTGYMFPSCRLDRSPERLSPQEAARIRAYIDSRCMSEENFAERKRRIIAGIEYERENECGEIPEEGSGIKCRAGTSSAWIDWKGNMTYCGMVPADSGRNVLTRGFDACWKETVTAASEVRLPAKCEICEYRHLCNNCAASQLCETGGYASPPPYICSLSECTPDAYSSVNTDGKGENNET